MTMFGWFKKRPVVEPATPMWITTITEKPVENPVKDLGEVQEKPKRKYTPKSARRKSLAVRNKDIAERYAAGDISKSKLARIYGLTPPRILQILRSEGVDTTSPKAGTDAKKFDPPPVVSVKRYSVTRSQREWSSEDVANLSALWGDKSLSVKEIAELIGVSESSAKCKARRLNLQRYT